MHETPTRDLVERRVYEALATFGPEPEDIRPDALLEDLDLDSLDLVELAQLLEDDYGMHLDTEDFKGVATVGDALAVILSRLPLGEGR